MTSEERVKIFNSSPGNLHTIDGLNCELCNNNGFIAKVNNAGFEYMEKCKCQSTREALKKARKSGIDNLLEYTFEKYVVSDSWQKEIKEKAESFCRNKDSKWFYIGGQSGSGKTLICSIICSHIVKNNGMSLKYMLWHEETKKIKPYVNDKNYGSVMQEYYSADVLYIDDFLKTTRGELPTPADMNIAFELINHRMLQIDKITIISSEKTLKELISLDEATMSRIYEKSGPYKLAVQKDIKRNYRLKDITQQAQKQI